MPPERNVSSKTMVKVHRHRYSGSDVGSLLWGEKQSPCSGNGFNWLLFLSVYIQELIKLINNNTEKYKMQKILMGVAMNNRADFQEYEHILENKDMYQSKYRHVSQ